jgi:hypothetical protein
MTKHDEMGYWYKCIKCGKDLPIPDFVFITQHGEKVDEIHALCPFCDIPQFFQFSGTNKRFTQREALFRFDTEQRIKDGIIRFETYWES